MKNIIRFTALLLAVVCCFAFFGCSKPSEKEVLDAYRQLYPKAYELAQVIYGQGLPHSDTGERYAPVADSSPYKTAAELESAILSVYTQEYYDDVLKTTLFSGVAANDDGLLGLSPRYTETNGALHIDTQYQQLSVPARSTESASVTKIKKRYAVISVPYTASTGEAKTKECTLVLTENGWRFDTIA